MQILNLSFGQDTGGQQLRTAAGFARWSPQDRYTSMARQKTFYEVSTRFSLERLKHDFWPNADVVHLHNDLRSVDRLRHVIRNWSARKPTLVHYHGSAFRTRPDHYLEQLQKRPDVVPIASTPDLVSIAPEILTWVPAPYDPDVLQSYRAAQTDPDTLHIAHAPTNRVVKSTQVLIDAVQKMRNLGVKVELDLIEGVQNVECLRRKGRADVYVDQLLLGYGCNAVEAWGMGIPVIAGIDVDHVRERIRQPLPANAAAFMEETWNGIPYMAATEATLFRALCHMRNPDIRLQYARKGLEHFSRFHTAEKVVPLLRSLYQKAIDGS